MKIKALFLISASLFLLPVNAHAVFSGWVVTEDVEPEDVPKTVPDRPLWLKLRAAINACDFDEMEAVVRENPQVMTRENAKYAATYGNPDSVQIFVELARSLGLEEVCKVMPIAAISSPRAEEILSRLSDCGINVGTTEASRTFAYNQNFSMRVSNEDTPDPSDWKLIRSDSKGGLRPMASLWRQSVLETLVRRGLNVNASAQENGVEFYPVIRDIWGNPRYFDRIAFFKMGLDPNAFVRTDIPISAENIFDSKSLLGTAVEQNDFPLVRLLVKSGADVNVPVLGRTIERSSSHPYDTYYLWETPLDRALLDGNAEIARWLRAHGAELSPKSEEQLRQLLLRMREEIKYRQQNSGEISQAGRKQIKKLETAISLYHEFGVFLRSERDPKKQLETLLLVNDIPAAVAFWENAGKEDLPILEKVALTYLGKNASPAFIKAVLKRVPADGKSVVEAFFSQIRKGNLIGVKAFAENGVSVHATNWTRASALFEAVMEREPEIVKFLVENGADIHSRTYPGYTPFSYAEMIRDTPEGEEISNYLREADALKKAENMKGKEAKK